MSPMAGKWFMLSLLSLGWFLAFWRVQRLDMSQTYHLAAYQRDRRKARFYTLSVWLGLAVAFLSFACQDALGAVSFDSLAQREWVLGIIRMVGMWGLLITAAVWLQVGQRAGQPNADGQSLMPVREARREK